MDKNITKDELLKLIPWFTKSRYSDIKNASDKAIYEELHARFMVHHTFAREDIRLDYQNKLFCERNPLDTNECIEYDNENVTPLHPFEIATMASQLKVCFDDTENYAYLHQFNNIQQNAFDGKGFCVGISLSHATDKQIIQELKVLLKNLRNILDVPEPKRHTAAQNLNRRKLFTHSVFEYLDLTLWGKANGFSITPSLVADMLPHKQVTYDDVRKKTLPFAEKALTFEFLEQFKADIKFSKKNPPKIRA